MYDVIIVGSGPAGLTAGRYACRRGFETLILEKEGIGGELVNRHEIDTYPGYPEGIAGTDLRSKLVAALEAYEPDVELAGVEELVPGTPHVVRTGGGEYRATAVIVATGGSYSDLGVPGEDEYGGRGVFYCAQCDGPLYGGEHIAVVGSSDHALTDARFLTQFASKVTVVDRGGEVTAGEHLRTEVEADPDIEVVLGTEVTAVDGADGVIEALELRDTASGEEWTMDVGGLYVCTGREPNTSFLDGTVPLADDGSIVVDAGLETGVDGVFAAGDVRQQAGHEVAAAVGDGVVALKSAREYIAAHGGLDAEAEPGAEAD